MNFNEKKAQGSLEYLLIIGVAILVAAIVIYVVVQAIGGGQDTTISNLTDAQKGILTGKCQLETNPNVTLCATLIDTNYTINCSTTPSNIVTVGKTNCTGTYKYIGKIA
ncbi:MAG: class III signal peptide-containing protein [Candidatus ainarchaeum sp.]|nr:class III signal peptide-containing protein [Candidatus ainarchaeum sp.]